MPVLEVLLDPTTESVVRDGDKATNIARIVSHDLTMNIKNTHAAPPTNATQSRENKQLVCQRAELRTPPARRANSGKRKADRGGAARSRAKTT
jgi:hypothetical protein